MADGKVVIDTTLNEQGAINDVQELNKAMQKCFKELIGVVKSISSQISSMTLGIVSNVDKALDKTTSKVKQSAKEISSTTFDVPEMTATLDIDPPSQSEVSTIATGFQDDIQATLNSPTGTTVYDNFEIEVPKDDIAQIPKEFQKTLKEVDKEKAKVKSTSKEFKELGDTGSKAMKQISNSTKQTSSAVGGLKSVAKKLGGMLVAAFSVKALVDFGKQALQLSSDLTETQNVVDTAFGSMVGKMEEFSKSAIDNFGISELTAKRMGSVYASMGRGLGQSLDSATDSAIEMTRRVADLASYYNLQIDEANTIGRAVYSGESEPLKRVGIIMTETELSAYALANGYDKLYKNMSSAEKVEVRQAFFLDKTNLAAGDFVRTQDSWANQTKILQERWKQFMTLVGNTLVQILKPGLELLNKFVDYLIRAAQSLNDLLGIKAQTSSASAGIADVTVATDELTDATTGLTEAQKKQNDALGAYDKLNVITSKDTSSTANATGTGTGIGADGGSLIPDEDVSATGSKLSKLTEFFAQFSDTFAHLKEVFSDVFSDIAALGAPLEDYFNNSFLPFLSNVAGTAGHIMNELLDTFADCFSDIWNEAAYPMLQEFIEVGLPMMTDFKSKMVDTMRSAFDTVLPIFQKVWRDGVVPILRLVKTVYVDLMESLSEFWQKYGEPIFTGIQEAIQNIGEIVMLVWDNYLGPIVQTIIEAATDLWENHLKPLVDEFLALVGEVATTVEDVYNKYLAPIVKWFVTYVYPIISAIIQTLVKIIKNILGVIIDVIKNTISNLKNIIQFVKNVFSGNWKGAWQNVKNIFSNIFHNLASIVTLPIKNILTIVKGVATKIKDAFVNAWNGIKVVWSRVKGFFGYVVQGIKDVFKSIPDWFKNTFSNAWQKVKDVFSKGGKVFSGIKDGILDALKNVINGLIKGINKVISKPFEGINAALDKIRSISILGKHPFNGLPTISTPQIPELAKGSVLPANRPFMAIVGDQKHGTNVEAPLDTIKQALIEALQDKSANTGSPSVINLSIDGNKLFSWFLGKNQEYKNRYGMDAV